MDHGSAVQLSAKVKGALQSLEQQLRSAGYDPDEVDGIVQGAREHAESSLDADAIMTDADLIELIQGFSVVDLPPQRSEEIPESYSPLIAVGLGVTGCLIMAVAIFFDDPDMGGAFMLLAGLFGAMALVIGRLTRHHSLAKAAMIIGGAIVLFLACSLGLVLAES